ncbi:MAG TPA: ATP-binding protein [Kofleriaceae bacterium]|nr:ATP-binding protein [Kofleriaceae bacterium]
MTEGVDLREFVSGFIAESDELIATANTALLEIEAANLAGETRPRAVRDLFRALHTIKGLAAMIGVEPIVEVAHELESLVRIADRAGGALERDAVDVSLRGVAAIAERVRAVADQQLPRPVPGELMDAIAAAAADLGRARARAAGVAPDVRPGDSVPRWDVGLAAGDIQQVTAAWRAGRKAWRVSFLPSEANAARGVTIASVRARLSQLGDVIKVLPRSTPGQGAGIAFDLLVASGAPGDAVAEAAATTADRMVELTPPSEPAPAPAPAPARAAGDGDAPSASSDAAPAGDGGPTLGRSLVRVELARLDELQDQLSLLIVSRFRLEREISALAERGTDVRGLHEIAALQGRQLRDLRRAILRARMVRVAEVLEPLTLLVRSLGRGARKEVRLEIDARDAELDKAVADRLLPALVHLVRNAVDHAIEPGDEREARGKPRVGTVQVRCHDVGGHRLELVVRDDGRGIDRREVARRAGRPVDDDADLLDVLTAPGFSTRDVATRTSGRGLGMDIVRRIATADLGGELALWTEPGQGTAFTLRVPLTIAVVEVFSFVCGPQTFVVPVSSVEEIFELREGQDVLPPAAPGASSPVRLAERRGQAVPLRSLGTLLAIDDGAAARKAIVIRRQGAPVGFTVDRMLGRREVVVRPVDDALVKVPGITGSTDLGDGSPTLVLDLAALGARSGERTAP